MKQYHDALKYILEKDKNRQYKYRKFIGDRLWKRVGVGLKKNLHSVGVPVKRPVGANMIEKIRNFFKSVDYSDMSKHRAYTTLYEDLCQ